jgi:hypothetical protein
MWPVLCRAIAATAWVTILGGRYQFVMYPVYFAVSARLLTIVVVLALCHWTLCSLRVQDEVALHMREPR